MNNVYITPPKPIVTPQSLDEAIRKANGTTAVVEDAAVPAKEPAPEESTSTEPKLAQPKPVTPPTGVRLPIPIIPVNDPEHNTILTTPPLAPVPDYVLPPSPRARSTSPPPTEARRPYPAPAPVPEPEPVKLHEVEPTPEGVVLAPELPVDEKKQEAAAAIPIDCTAPEHLASKLEELVVTPEEEKEKIVAPETVPLPETPAAKPEEKKREEAAKPTPSALPTPPATPNPKAGGGSFPRGSQSPSPTNSPSSSRFGTAKSRKKRHSIFGKIKEIFSSDKDKEKVKSPK